MIETLKKLAAFNKDELKSMRQNKRNDQRHQNIEEFIAQLESDFKYIVPAKRDALRQAENLLTALLKIAKTQPSLVDSEAAKKLDLISEIIPNAGNETGYLISELYGAIDSFPNKETKEIEQQLISHRMDAIIAALNKKTPKPASIVQAYADLGQFIQDLYPGEKIDSIQKKMAGFDKYYSTEIPSLKVYAALSEARVRVHQQVGALENTQEVAFMNSLSKGIALFGTLMGAERVAQKSAEYNVTEKDVDYAKDPINNLLYEYRLAALDTALTRMSKSYEELYEGTGTHQIDLNQLLTNIKSITDNNDISAVKKYDQITRLLRHSFEERKQDYERGIKDSLIKGLFSPPNFIDYLNKKTDHHLYSRMIGVLLQDIYIQRYTGTDNQVIRDRTINQLGLDRLIIPDTEIYQEIRLFNTPPDNAFKPV